MRKSTSKALGIVTGSLLLTLASGVTQANSKRVSFSENGHIYQRFDGYEYWYTAKSKCEGKGGHLATLTSEEENQFVTEELLDTELGALSGIYTIGLTDVYAEGGWEWVTGENFSYSNWSSGEPNNGREQDFGSINNLGTWGDHDPDDGYKGYICEWSKPISIATNDYADISGDGVDESLILFYDYKLRRPALYVYDMVNNKKRKQARFGTAPTNAKAVISISDQTDDGWPEAAVLYYENRLTWLEILDIKKNQTLDKFLVLEGKYKPLSLSLTTDINENGSEDFVIQGSHNSNFKSTKKSLIEVRDSETGELINSREF